MDLAQTDNDGKNVLHIALERKNKNVVKILVESGVDPNQKDSSGVTAIKIARDSVTRKMLENEVVQMLDEFSDLQCNMEQASAASKQFRFHVRMCTTYFGLLMTISLQVLAVLLQSGVLDSNTFGHFIYYQMTMFVWFCIALLGISPNDFLSIRICSLVLGVLSFGYSIFAAMTAFTMLFIHRNEFRDYNPETTVIEKSEYRMYQCGSDLPDVGCSIVITRFLIFSASSFALAICFFQNLRKGKSGIQIYNSDRDKGEKYNDHAFLKPARSALGNVWFGFLGTIVWAGVGAGIFVMRIIKIQKKKIKIH